MDWNSDILSRRTFLRAMSAASAFTWAEAPSWAASDPWQDVVRRAQQEGTVVVYATSSGDAYRPIFDLFTQRYGIRVLHVGGRGNEFPQRIRTEQIAGRFNGDVTVNGHGSLIRHAQENNLQPFVDLPNLRHLLPGVVPGKLSVPVFFAAWAILINTRLVKPGHEPRSWLDMLRPEWRGKIILDDPRVPSAGSGRFSSMLLNFGDQYEWRMHAQKPVITMDTGARRRLLLGEFAMMVDGFKFWLDDQKRGGRLPLRLIIPREGVISARFDAGMLRNAPHPHAARLFMNFLLSPEIQMLMAARGSSPAVQGIAERMPANVRGLFAAPRLKIPPYDPTNAGLRAAQRVYGRL
ncbi:MAG: extracellular solute-binding protein [Sphingobium sp.]